MKPNHLYELVQDSGINPALAALNCQSIQGDEVYSVLLYAKSRQEVRRNDGRLRDYWLNKFSGIAEAGGLYFSGLDPQQNWEEPMEWGRLKPDTPRLDNEGKPQKYESPVRPATNRVCYFRVPLEDWELVSSRYNIPIPENVIVTPVGEALGFWHWVTQYPEIPVILTEGEKKAQLLLSMGFVAIALPGIWGGRVGLPLLERLHPDLMAVAQKDRKFIILFDHETRDKTKRDIYRATSRTGQCIENAGCRCEVALLPGPEKGIDDWVVSLGNKAECSVVALLGDAQSLKEYRQSFFVPIRGLQKYKPNVRFNLRYLSDGIKNLPESGLVGILSDLGTGKTYLLEKWREHHPDERFLNNGHRVNLLKNLAQRLKTQMYSAINAGDLGRADALSITIDSLHKMANNLKAYGCLFVDEAAQYVCHLLRSKTCKKFRAEILEVLEYLVRNSKLVVLADAHLDDVTIDFFRAMRPEGEQPFVIQNDWRSGGRTCYWYEGSNSSALVANIHAVLLDGAKVIVVADSKRFVKKLERTLLDSKDFNRVEIQQGDTNALGSDEGTPESEPDRRLRIWALHSQNSGSEENVALIKDITNSVKLFDVMIASPTIGTGVDICGGEGDYHFDVIFGAFHAVSQPATECAQQLWRYRPNVPMHIWAAPRPPFGYQESNPRKIKEQILQKNEMTAFLIRVDRETGKRGAEKDWALDAYCQIEAKRNRSINNLRQDLRSLLEEMGNTIIPMGDEADEAASERMKAAGEAIDHAHCLAVANSKDIDRLTYESRQRQDYLSPEEFLECDKFRIRDTYGMDVTPELVAKDDNGRLIRKIANLEAILAEPGETIPDENGKEFVIPPEMVLEADKSDREIYPLCTDWRNRSVAWMLRHKLGLGDFVKSLLEGAEYSGDTPEVAEIGEKSRRFAPHIKAILGRSIAPKDPNTKIMGEYLGQFALGTKSRRPLNENGERVRIYSAKEEDVNFILQVLTYRQQKREERERRRQEAAEKNAHHVAMMQRQYGVPPMSTPPSESRESTTRGGLDTTLKQVQTLTENWEETIKVYGELLVEGFDCGVEAIKALLKPWTTEERWGAIQEFEALSPGKMAHLVALEPNWFEWCEV